MESSSPPRERATLSRDWAICSECRRRKGKCKPQDRDWENQQERCEHCISRNLPCSPNYKKKDDPAVLGTLEETVAPATANAPAGIYSPETEGLKRSPASSHLSDSLRASSGLEGSFQSHRAKDLHHQHNVLSDQEYRDKVLEGLQELHCLCTTFASRLTLNSCQITHSHLSFNVTNIKQWIYRVFIGIFQVLQQVYRQGKDDFTLWILYALHNALITYRCLWDAALCVQLSTMAKMFEKFNHRWAYETMLDILSVLPISHQEDPCFLLANSLLHSSVETHRILSNCWREWTGEDTAHVNLQFPCLQRAAQFKNGGITLAVLANHHVPVTTPGTYEAQRMRVHQWLKQTGGSEKLIQSRPGIDFRGVWTRTALHEAAARGSQDGCSFLVHSLADPNARDDHGHTILEVACQGGHLDIAKQLIGVGAEVDPQLDFCTSTPLQAAIESDNFNYRLVQHLLDLDANVNVQRLRDHKSAIDIARDKGYFDLAAIMHKGRSASSRFPFGGGHISSQTH